MSEGDQYECATPLVRRSVERSIRDLKFRLASSRSFRECTHERYLIANWLNDQGRSINEWYRRAFRRDFRSIERVIDQGCDLERQIGFIESIRPVVAHSLQTVLSNIQSNSEGELLALSNLARDRARLDEFLTLAPDRDWSLGYRREGDWSKNLKIAILSFRMDPEGLDSLHQCVEHALATARVWDDRITIEACEPLSVALIRCRVVVRMIEFLESSGYAGELIDRFSRDLSELRRIRICEVHRLIESVTADVGDSR